MGGNIFYYYRCRCRSSVHSRLPWIALAGSAVFLHSNQAPATDCTRRSSVQGLRGK